MPRAQVELCCLRQEWKVWWGFGDRGFYRGVDGPPKPPVVAIHSEPCPTTLRIAASCLEMLVSHSQGITSFRG